VQWRQRAETAERQVGQLVDAILSRFPAPAASATPPAPAAPATPVADQVGRETWWSRWFGASRRTLLNSKSNPR
jgi:hypothetical protein